MNNGFFKTTETIRVIRNEEAIVRFLAVLQLSVLAEMGKEKG